MIGILIAFLICAFCGIDPKRVILVDSYQGNLLFRTNNPI